MFSSRTFSSCATTSAICSAKFATKVSSFKISISLAIVESSLVELCLRDFGPIDCCLLFGCVELDFGRAVSLDNGALAVTHQLTLSGYCFRILGTSRPPQESCNYDDILLLTMMTSSC